MYTFSLILKEDEFVERDKARCDLGVSLFIVLIYLYGVVGTQILTCLFIVSCICLVPVMSFYLPYLIALLSAYLFVLCTL